MNKNNYCVIMAGGVGSRFWPMSKTKKPKQFIDVLGTGKTLLQQTFSRFEKICPTENIYIVTSDIYNDVVKEQLPQITQNQILLEPDRRNTAPCVAYANYKILKQNPDAKIVVAPSDHLILNESEFIKIIEQSFNFVAKNDALLTLGIKPNRPDTGYGYIQIDKKTKPDNGVNKVKTFTEKPNLEMATFFVNSGEFYWNSGIFIWSLKSIIKAFDEKLPEVNNLFKDGINIYDTPDEQNFILKTYTSCKNISIDYGIMEKSDNVYVLPSDFGWSDLGTWGSLYTHMNLDNNKNAIKGRQNVLTYDVKNSIIHSSGDRLIVLQGLDDYIVVDTNETLLICKKQDEQKIKQIVNDIKINKGENYI